MLDLGQNNTIEEIENLLDKNENDPLLYVKLGNLKAESGLFDEAVICFEKSLNINNNFNPALFCMGNVLIEINKFEVARNCLKKLLNNSPEEFDIADVEFSLGICYMELNQFEDAIKTFKKVVSIDEKDLFSHIKLSEIYRRIKKYDESIIECKNVLKKKNDFAMAYCEMGLSYFELNEIEDARKQYIVLTKLNKELAIYLKEKINLI